MTKDNQTVSIITVTYNTKDFLKEYVESIFAGTIVPDEVLIYDGGSSDGTVEMARNYQQKHPEIKIVEGENVGFAAGNNIIAEQAKSKFLFFLNPDTKIDKNCLQELLNHPERERALLMPKRYLFDGTFLHHGMGLDVFGYPADGKIFFADGAAIFMRKELFIDLGMFDQDYFMYQEDIDLSWRARLLGIDLVTVPKSYLYHYSGGATQSGGIKKEVSKYTTNTFKRYLGERNVLQNLIKNYSFLMLALILPLVIVSNLLEILLFVLTFNFKFVSSYPKAYYWIITHLPTILQKRKAIQSKRKVSDRDIVANMSISSSKIKYFFKFGIPKIK